MSVPAPRFDIEMPVGLTSGAAKEPFRAVTVNLSESGMLVRADRSEERGSHLHFEFHSFGGVAEVIWEREDEDGGALLGMRFSSMKRQDRKTLARILSSPSFSSA